MEKISTNDEYSAVTIVSGMIFGEAKKDQDRARWYGPDQIACVCDGVTSSPQSGRAAELVTQFAPIMYGSNNKNNLQTICDLLINLRKEYQQSEAVLPESISTSMKKMLHKIMQEKKAISFQTTMTAAKFECMNKTVTANILRCGDSAFFAFSGEGELLSSSLNFNPDNNNSSLYDSFYFRSGDQLLVRFEGLLSNNEDLAKNSRIKKEHTKNWLVCNPIEICSCNTNTLEECSWNLPKLSLNKTDHLLIPKFLYGTQLFSKGERYFVLDYSSAIRVISSNKPYPEQQKIIQRGSTTEVLPDHFYQDRIESYKDCFPVKTHFVLCSDGFYNSFSEAKHMCDWLQDNARLLKNPEKRQPVLRELHSNLNSKTGDDDISFIWIYPKSEELPKSN